MTPGTQTLEALWVLHISPAGTRPSMVSLSVTTYSAACLQAAVVLISDRKFHNTMIRVTSSPTKSGTISICGIHSITVATDIIRIATATMIVSMIRLRSTTATVATPRQKTLVITTTQTAM